MMNSSTQAQKASNNLNSGFDLWYTSGPVTSGYSLYDDAMLMDSSFVGAARDWFL